MRARILDAGSYQLFELPTGHRLLRLNERDWFIWILADQGDQLVHWAHWRSRARYLRAGEFLLLTYPASAGVAHLFLTEGDAVREYLLPYGLPDGDGDPRRIVTTSEAPGRLDLLQDIGGGPLPRDAPQPWPAPPSLRLTDGAAEGRTERDGDAGGAS